MWVARMSIRTQHGNISQNGHREQKGASLFSTRARYTIWDSDLAHVPAGTTMSAVHVIVLAMVAAAWSSPVLVLESKANPILAQYPPEIKDLGECVVMEWLCRTMLKIHVRIRDMSCTIVRR